MSMPNFGNQTACRYRQPPQKDGPGYYVIDVSKAFLGSLLGCLLALAIMQTVAEYRMKAKMKDAMQDVQKSLQGLNLQKPAG
jgi:hypothetical protein